MTAAPVVAVDGFEGPLDVLLGLVEAQRIDLAGLPIVALIDSFCAAMAAALDAEGGAAALGQWGDWLVMAAGLTLLRSRLLLPGAPDAAQAQHEAEALRRRLIERAAVTAGADWLDRQTQPGRDVFTRGRAAEAAPARFGDITELLRACLALLLVPAPQQSAYLPRPPPLWTIGDALQRVRTLLSARPDGGELAAFLPVAAGADALRCRAAVASTLCAGLELARTGEALLRQDQALAPIEIRASVQA